MNDQANILRELVRRESESRQAGRGASRLIVVAAGKGGVGTTTLAANLAAALVRSGRTCVLVDGNPSRADATTLCGLDAEFGVSHVVAGWRSAAETLLDGPGGLRVLPGVWDRGDETIWTESAQGRLIDELRQLGGKAQFVVIDAGSGLGPVVGRFWRAADLVLVVSTPDAMSIMDAYAAVKVHSEGAAAAIHTVANRAADAGEAEEVHARIARACHRFLALPVSEAGYLPTLPASHPGPAAPSLFVLAGPESTASRCLGRIAQCIMESVPTARPTALPAHEQPAGR